MAAGGIHDQLGGGFHRYSTDEKWLVPHFEIMLYDQAMLSWCYLEAYRQTESPQYARLARGILDFVLREMSWPQGAFHAALAAEADGQEGASYVWEKKEIDSLFPAEDARVFAKAYGLDRGPNFTGDTSVLYLPQPLEKTAAEINSDLEELEARLEKMRSRLMEVRRQRKGPLADTKIITSWNGLFIRSLAYAGQILSEQRYLEAAARAVNFVLAQRTGSGELSHCILDGSPKHPAFLDDYAHLIQGLLALDSAGAAAHEETWRDRAAELYSEMLSRFHDPQAGGFFYSPSDADDLFVRQKIATDSPISSGNAVAAMVVLELDRAEIARDTLALFAGQMQHDGASISAMVQAALLYTKRHGPIQVCAAAPVH